MESSKTLTLEQAVQLLNKDEAAFDVSVDEPGLTIVKKYDVKLFLNLGGNR